MPTCDMCRAPLDRLHLIRSRLVEMHRLACTVKARGNFQHRCGTGLVEHYLHFIGGACREMSSAGAWHLLRGDAAEAEHADLLGDMVPGQGAVEVLQVLAQQRAHADDALRHPLHLLIPPVVPRRVSCVGSHPSNPLAVSLRACHQILHSCLFPWVSYRRLWRVSPVLQGPCEDHSANCQGSFYIDGAVCDKTPTVRAWKQIGGRVLLLLEIAIPQDLLHQQRAMQGRVGVHGPRYVLHKVDKCIRNAGCLSRMSRLTSIPV